MAEGDALEPGTPLSVAEAARLAGCTERELRARMDEGRLLFEVQRKGAKESILIRYVDLTDAFPERLGPKSTEPEPHSGQAEAPSPEPSGAAAEDPGPEPDLPQAQPEGVPALEAGVASLRLEVLQESQRMLQEQLQDLAEQRERLRHQGDELRSQLSRVEQERQASTAGLLLMQQRMLELESGPVLTLEEPLHRRPLVWWAVGSSVVLLGALLSMRGMRSSFAAQSAGLAEHVEEARQALATESAAAATERAQAAAELDAQTHKLAERDLQWELEQRRAHEDRQAFAAALEAERRSAAELRTALNEQLQLERAGSVTERKQAEQTIAELQFRANAAWERLEAERENAAQEARRQALLVEQRLEQEARARGALDARLSTVRLDLEATASKATELELELQKERAASAARQRIGRLFRYLGERRQRLSGPLDLTRRILHQHLGEHPTREPAKSPK